MKGSTLPDLLPDTFRLAETSSLFSHVSDPVFQVPKSSPQTSNDQSPNTHPHRVEVRESDLLTTKHVSMMPTGQFMSANVNTISILESVDTFEPEFVEMVHIIDASEDDEIDEGIVRREPQAYSVKERDLLLDSEEPNKKRRSLIPNLKEILCAPMGQDSFSEIEVSQQRDSRDSDSQTVGFVYICILLVNVMDIIDLLSYVTIEKRGFRFFVKPRLVNPDILYFSWYLLGFPRDFFVLTNSADFNVNIIFDSYFSLICFGLSLIFTYFIN